MPPHDQLNVIALISGGKDSFFSLLHCTRHGHQVVALANLYPPLSSAKDDPPPPQDSVSASASEEDAPAQTRSQAPPEQKKDHVHADAPLVVSSAGNPALVEASDSSDVVEDLNSFMYQTVGHQLIPLYAAATGIPLYRAAIEGTAVQSGITYASPPLPLPTTSTTTTAASRPLSPSSRVKGEPPLGSNGIEMQRRDDSGGAVEVGLGGMEAEAGCRSHLTDGSSIRATNSSRHAVAPAASTTTTIVATATTKPHPEIVSSMEPTSAFESVRTTDGKSTIVVPITQQGDEDNTSARHTTHGGDNTCEKPSPIAASVEAAQSHSHSQTQKPTRMETCPDAPNDDDHHGSCDDAVTGAAVDETEDMYNLLRKVMDAHPEANAICAGAILSTYQRVRVESVATRLGLTPLAFLWKFPILPCISSSSSSFAATEGGRDGSPGLRRRSRAKKSAAAKYGGGDPAQLLMDMSAASLTARIVKVASAGLDDDFLWEAVTDVRGITRLKKAIRRFGGGTVEDGAVIGEGGEYETLVVDGPDAVFKGRIEVDDGERVVVREGGGCSWLAFKGARVVMKTEVTEKKEVVAREPGLFDVMFRHIMEDVVQYGPKEVEDSEDVMFRSSGSIITPPSPFGVGDLAVCPPEVEHWVGMLPQHLSSVSPSSLNIQDETSHIMVSIQDRLTASSLPPTAVINTLVVLRQMSDFASFNTIYGRLFPDPIPPARVCIACGDMLSSGTNVFVYLTVLSPTQGTEILPAGKRSGLHVQSRSYWTPANIGPYSQAVIVPLSCSLPVAEQDHGSAGGAETVTIAGQIPLLPSSMVLLNSIGDTTRDLVQNIVLSLQHLWRIALDLKVQWFIGGVAYFPRGADIRLCAQMAGEVWREAHLWGLPTGDDDDNDDEDGEEAGSEPDLWDLKYNPQFQNFAFEGAEDTSRRLPLFDILRSSSGSGSMEGGDETKTRKARRGVVPRTFAVEVETLPRGAGVEWHSPLSLRGLGRESCSFFTSAGAMERGLAWGVEHFVVEDGQGDGKDGVVEGAGRLRFVHSTVWISDSGNGGEATREGRMSSVEVGRMLRKALSSSFSRPEGSENVEVEVKGGREVDLEPYLVYVDEGKLGCLRELQGVDGGILPFPLVPCHSIWSSRGGGEQARVLIVGYFRGRYRSTATTKAVLGG